MVGETDLNTDLEATRGANLETDLETAGERDLDTDLEAIREINLQVDLEIFQERDTHVRSVRGEGDFPQPRELMKKTRKARCLS